MTVLLVFGLFVVLSTAHKITHLEVPRYGDPRARTALACHFITEKGDPPLHSVKFYRGNDEIFRFIPEQEPYIRTFNTSTGGDVGGNCDDESCSITLKLPQTYNTKVSFTCEVSTEGPRFAVVKQTKNLTVAVILTENPVITGVPDTVQLGADVVINCTTGPAMPPANIKWYIDGKPEKFDPMLMNNTQVSSANERGLRTSWRALHIKAATSKDYIELRCEATQPTRPPYVRSANATIVVARSPNLSMFTASGSSPPLEWEGVLSAVCVMVHIFSKISALTEIATMLC